MEASLDDIAKLSYEQAFHELETIINGLETNQKSLEESLALYERGQALAQHCAALLDHAELRVRQLSEIELSASAEDYPESDMEDGDR
jgi:exodeoxyribonuclease VII small subunit